MPRESLKVEIVNAKPRHELWISMCALAVSLFALGVSIWQTHQTQMLARVSMKPNVDFVFELDPMHARPGLYLVNTGTGPAIIRELEVYLDGDRVATWSDLANRVSREPDQPWQGNGPHWAEVGSGTHLRTNEPFAVFVTPREHVKDRNSFEKLHFRRIGVWVRYCSMHDECSETKTPHGRTR